MRNREKDIKDKEIEKKIIMIYKKIKKFERDEKIELKRKEQINILGDIDIKIKYVRLKEQWTYKNIRSWSNIQGVILTHRNGFFLPWVEGFFLPWVEGFFLPWVEGFFLPWVEGFFLIKISNS